MTKERLAKLIKVSGLKQKEVAEALDRSETALTFYLSGERPIPDNWAEVAEDFFEARRQAQRKELDELEEAAV